MDLPIQFSTCFYDATRINEPRRYNLQPFSSPMYRQCSPPGETFRWEFLPLAASIFWPTMKGFNRSVRLFEKPHFLPTTFKVLISTGLPDLPSKKKTTSLAGGWILTVGPSLDIVTVRLRELDSRPGFAVSSGIHEVAVCIPVIVFLGQSYSNPAWRLLHR